MIYSLSLSLPISLTTCVIQFLFRFIYTAQPTHMTVNVYERNADFSLKLVQVIINFIFKNHNIKRIIAIYIVCVAQIHIFYTTYTQKHIMHFGFFTCVRNIFKSNGNITFN